MTVKDLFQTLWARRNLSMVRLAAEIGVHRNWLIGLRDGNVPCARDGQVLAGADPRYLALGTYLELHGVARKDDFVRQAESEQSCAAVDRRPGMDGLSLAVMRHLTRLGAKDAIPAMEIWMYVAQVVSKHGISRADAYVVASAKSWRPTKPPKAPADFPDSLWGLDVGWKNPEDVQRQAREIFTTVLSHATSDPSLRDPIARILSRLQHFPPDHLTGLIRQGA